MIELRPSDVMKAELENRNKVFDILGMVIGKVAEAEKVNQVNNGLTALMRSEALWQNQEQTQLYDRQPEYGGGSGQDVGEVQKVDFGHATEYEVKAAHDKFIKEQREFILSTATHPGAKRELGFHLDQQAVTSYQRTQKNWQDVRQHTAVADLETLAAEVQKSGLPWDQKVVAVKSRVDRMVAALDIWPEVGVAFMQKFTQAAQDIYVTGNALSIARARQIEVKREYQAPIGANPNAPWSQEYQRDDYEEGPSTETTIEQMSADEALVMAEQWIMEKTPFYTPQEREKVLQSVRQEWGVQDAMRRRTEEAEDNKINLAYEQGYNQNIDNLAGLIKMRGSLNTTQWNKESNKSAWTNTLTSRIEKLSKAPADGADDKTSPEHSREYILARDSLTTQRPLKEALPLFGYRKGEIPKKDDLIVRLATLQGATSDGQSRIGTSFARTEAESLRKDMGGGYSEARSAITSAMTKELTDAKGKGQQAIVDYYIKGLANFDLYALAETDGTKLSQWAGAIIARTKIGLADSAGGGPQAIGSGAWKTDTVEEYAFTAVTAGFEGWKARPDKVEFEGKLTTMGLRVAAIVDEYTGKQHSKIVPHNDGTISVLYGDPPSSEYRIQPKGSEGAWTKGTTQVAKWDVPTQSWKTEVVQKPALKVEQDVAGLQKQIADKEEGIKKFKEKLSAGYEGELNPDFARNQDERTITTLETQLIPLRKRLSVAEAELLRRTK